MGFQQGLSGLTAAATNLEVIGNNIANANTVGAKSSRAEFSDMYASAVGGGPSMGIGTRLATVSQNHTQGSITTTGNNLDLALNGPGYFLLKEAGAQSQASSAASSLTLSRNGQFKADSAGYIVNNNGMRVQGYLADESGVVAAGGSPGDLTVPKGTIDPQATAVVSLGLNLNPADSVPKTTPFDQTDGTSFNYSTSYVVYDDLGQSAEINVYFVKTTANEWEVHATANGTQVDLMGDLTTIPDGTNGAAFQAIQFPTDASPNPASPPRKIALDFVSLNAALADSTNGLAYQFGGVPTGSLSRQLVMDLSTATQLSGDYSVTDLSQDGFPKGVITGYGFDKQGVLSAQYSNGEKRVVGQVVLRNVRNPQGLEPQGGNGWQETRNSGSSTDGVPGDEGLGELVTGALEESNVDVTAELVNLITAQRTYQANAQTIKTQDQVLQTFINMR